MASITNCSGRREIQVFCRDGKRRTIRLGKCDGRTALGIKLHIERLVESKHTGEARDTPLFPELKQRLLDVRKCTPLDAEYVINRYRNPEGNIRSTFLKLLKRANIEPRPKLLQNLRSTRQTELTETYPQHVVCAWLGNTEKVAEGHYLQVTQEHFEPAAGMLVPSGDEAHDAHDADDAGDAADHQIDDEADDGSDGGGTDGGGDDDGGNVPPSKSRSFAGPTPDVATNKNASCDAKRDAVGAGNDPQVEAPQFRVDDASAGETTTNENVPAGAGTCKNADMGAVGFEPTKA